MKKKILIVDDDEAIVDAISMVLDMEGYDIASTTKGNEIFEMIAKHRPDLILLDMLISGTDGRELCKTLKRNKETKEIPVVMISAHPSAKKTILECGANDFLPKPFETSELIKVVKQFAIKQ